MPRCLVFTLSVALVLLVPGFCLAAGDDCPDGWFCEPNAAPPAPGPGQGQPQPALPPPPGPRPSQPGPPPPVDGPASGPGYGLEFYPPAVYPPALGAEQSVPPPPPRRRHHRFREWGFNLHLEGALLADQPERDAAMGGLGFGFRYRALPPLAFEASIELLRGAEHSGYYRSEAGLLLDTLIFFNPRDAVQVYALGGLSFSRSNLSFKRTFDDDVFYRRNDQHYDYFGGQFGLGLEVRVSRRVAIAGDLLGFVRGRTDDAAVNSSDFIPAKARVSDTEGGALLRAGVTLYW